MKGEIYPDILSKKPTFQSFRTLYIIITENSEIIAGEEIMEVGKEGIAELVIQLQNGDSSTFLACESMAGVTVPDSVNSIGNNAFGFNRYSVGGVGLGGTTDAVAPLQNFRLYCTEGSAAAKYAADNGIEYEIN